MRRRLTIGAASLAAALAVAMLGSAAASAETSGHAYSFSFGESGSGNGQFSAFFGMAIAVDQSNGDLYLTDANNHRVEKFDSAGNFLEAWGWGVKNGANESQVCVAPEACQAGIAGGGPGEFRHPDGIAVDNSGGENNGDVYVADSSSPAGEQGLGYILKFDENGKFLGTIDGTGSPVGKFGELPVSGAIGVDGQGYVWVTANTRMILKFSNEADNEYVGGSSWEAPSWVLGLAVNRRGSQLLLIGECCGHEGDYSIISNGTGAGSSFPCGNAESGPVTIAGNDDAFVGYYNTVCEITMSGQMLGEPFGSGLLCGVAGLAVNETTDVVYAADACQSKVFAFIPRVVPNVQTGTATNVGRTTATLTGEAAPDPSGGGEVTECRFEIGTDTSYGTTVPCEPAAPYGQPTSVHADLSGLTMDTTYHYRIAAKNSIDVNYGADRTFTPHRVLGLSTGAPTEVSQTTATLNGSFEPAGEDTHYFFEWGTDESYGNVTPTELEPGSTSGVADVHAALSGLATYTTYHYRVVASNSLGTSYGADEMVRTEPPSPPIVAGTAASGVTDSSAHLSGSINPSNAATVYRFQYGTDTSYGQQTQMSESIGEDESPHAVSASVSGLQPGTTYHFRLMATNFGGTTLGPDITFTTQAAPNVGSVSTSAIGTSGATLEAKVNPQLSQTAVHFEYGETTAYGSNTQELAIGADDGSHSVDATISGLRPGTTYHFRVVAANGIGITRSSDQTFTTGVAPPPPPPPPSVRCKKGFVKRHGRCVKKRGKRGPRHSHSRRGRA